MTIAFVIHTHKSLHQIERLVATIHSGLADKIVSISHNGSAAERGRIGAMPGVDHVIPAIGGRGQFGLIDCLLSELRRLDRVGRHYDWVVVLSGQDYPVRPLSELAAELASSPYDGYFYHFDTNVPETLPPSLFSMPEYVIDCRYRFQHWQLRSDSPLLARAIVSLPRRLLDRTRNYRLHTQLGITFGRRSAKLPFSAGFKLYGGSAWMTFRRTAAQSMLRFVDERPDITNYFRRVLAPEEAFLQTIMANDPSLHLSTRDLQYCDFANAHLGHARFLTKADLPRVEENGAFFARKFDLDSNPEIFDILDARVLAKKHASATVGMQ
jgi:hypothetical protein